MTKILNSYLEADIIETVDILKSGGIVALPTETVYGLAADSSNINAIKKIFTAKNRPINHPLILHVKSLNDCEKFIKNISDDAIKLAEHFWPGPLTLLLNKSNLVSNYITANSTKVAIRVPSNKIFTAILNIGDFALVAPSANIHQKLSPTKAEHVMHQMNGLIDAVLDGGNCEIGLESTIIDVTTSDIKILRSGPILQKDIELFLQKDIIDISKLNNNKVSGSMKSHYKPSKKLYLIERNQIQEYVNSDKKIIFIGYSDFFCNAVPIACLIRMPSEFISYQNQIYNKLYQADLKECDFLILEKPPEKQEWNAINDRLIRMCD
jgi:L-threonylcarbamoyladenylate synthase